MVGHHTDNPMGPAFSLLLVLTIAAAATSGAFGVFRLRHTSRGAVALAVVLVVGVAVGATGAALAAALAVGVGPTLQSRSEVVAYLAWLAVGGLAGAAAAVHVGMRVLGPRPDKDG